MGEEPPSPSDECRVTDSANPHVGDSTARYFGRVGPAVYWNLTAGYRITPKMKVNLYANNVRNTAGDGNEKRCYGDQLNTTTLYDAIGREAAAVCVRHFESSGPGTGDPGDPGKAKAQGSCFSGSPVPGPSSCISNCGTRKNPVLSMQAMNANRSFYFWYYGFPMPLAEEGLRSP
ncbi:TonB-dependent receptor [Xanthomonas hyacinthi]|uniref:TonB-dependent receptor n=1 Tax=Xanthomonas hyacinthi TaxID=56455 RepID=UPI00062DB062|nr:TonB-dependent receptor [Xanthomonas hyacinthi]KLD76929.1 hypothetical protein Y886_18605 [Xanthomonas hyacinthi DSM 19077]